MKTLNSRPSVFLAPAFVFGFALVAGAFLCGCIPYRFTGRPGVTGVVLDSNTRAPVAGATVTVASRETYADEMRGNAVTAADGSFSIPPYWRWGLYLPCSDTFDYPASLSVQRAGYF